MNRIDGSASETRLGFIGFDAVRQSGSMVERMREFQLIAASHSTATREEMKEYYAQIIQRFRS